MKVLDRTANLISLTLAVTSALVIAVIMVMTTADVIKRFFSGSSIPGTVEFSEVFLVCAVYFGLAYAMRRGAHVGVDIVVTKLGAKSAKVVQMVGLTVGIGVLGWMAIETTGTALHSISVNEYRYGLIQVPVWPAKLAIPIGLLALILECVVTMLKIARNETSASDESGQRDEAPALNPQGV